MGSALSRAVENIREDRSYTITYGYLVLCGMAVFTGLLLCALGDWLFGLGGIVTGLVGAEMWTGWVEMWWRYERHR